MDKSCGFTSDPSTSPTLQIRICQNTCVQISLIVSSSANNTSICKSHTHFRQNLRAVQWLQSSKVWFSPRVSVGGQSVDVQEQNTDHKQIHTSEKQNMHQFRAQFSGPVSLRCEKKKSNKHLRALKLRSKNRGRTTHRVLNRVERNRAHCPAPERTFTPLGANL